MSGPEYDSPGYVPEPEGHTRSSFLGQYPEHEELADIYWPEEAGDELDAVQLQFHVVLTREALRAAVTEYFLDDPDVAALELAPDGPGAVEQMSTTIYVSVPAGMAALEFSRSFEDQVQLDVTAAVTPTE